MRTKPEFRAIMLATVTRSERDALDRILAAGKRGEWKADAWFLEKRFSERWTQKLQVDVNHDFKEKVKTMSDDELLAMLANGEGGKPFTHCL
jgi:hypothetical protein